MLMSATEQRLSREELARRGDETYTQQVRPLLRPDDDGKFVAIDVESGAFEVDEDDHAAVSRLHARVAGAQVWLVRAGYPAAHRLRGGR
jgi:hypothetical protein